MRTAGHAYNLLSPVELDLIHRSALRILDEVGMEIQNRSLLEALAAFGLRVDFAGERVRFPPTLVERFISEADKEDWDNHVPTVGGAAGLYNGLYHDPLSNQLAPWTEESMAFYLSFPRTLSHVGSGTLLGCRLPVPPALEPLYERYYAWKYGAGDHGSIQLDELCPYVLEMHEALAGERGRPLRECFHGTVYLVPPLRLGRHEAYQVDYFWRRGLRVRIGDMFAMGASAPATLAGAVTLNLAEQLALRILDWALYGECRLALGGSISAMDMRTTIYPYGRPEMAIANVMNAQLARHYRAFFSGHAGLSDAKLPSVEAGAQKALTAIPTLMAGGSLWMDAGLLSTDEVCSPIQMVLDNEFLGALAHFTREFPVTEEAIGLDAILEAGPGGTYIDKPHTARHFRHEFWQPSLWSRQMLHPWIDQGCRLDVDEARQIVLAALHDGPPAPQISDSFERSLLSIIERARRRVARQDVSAWS